MVEIAKDGLINIEVGHMPEELEGVEIFWDRITPVEIYIDQRVLYNNQLCNVIGMNTLLETLTLERFPDGKRFTEVSIYDPGMIPVIVNWGSPKEEEADELV